MGYGYNENLPSQKPFMWIELETWLPNTDVCENIGVLAYGAYNALGLIGSEKGGVGIVHRDPNYVIGTHDVPHNAEVRAKLHATVVEILESSETSQQCFDEMSELGFEMRFTGGLYQCG